MMVKGRNPGFRSGQTPPGSKSHSAHHSHLCTHGHLIPLLSVLAQTLGQEDHWLVRLCGREGPSPVPSTGVALKKCQSLGPAEQVDSPEPVSLPTTRTHLSSRIFFLALASR